MDPISEPLTFGWLDWFFIVAYMVMLIGVGAYFSRRQDTLREYFLASKHMSWIPIGMSLLAALNSGIDYMAQPSAFIKYNIVIVVGSASWFLIYPYAFFVTMRMYRRLDIYSAYEYLEERFNVAVRCLAAVIFILWRLGWMATALYVPCLAFHTVTGGQLPLKPTILVLGAVATVVRLTCTGTNRRRLMDLGILPGTLLQAELKSPLGDPIAYRVREALIALRREQAREVEIEVREESSL